MPAPRKDEQSKIKMQHLRGARIDLEINDSGVIIDEDVRAKLDDLFDIEFEKLTIRIDLSPDAPDPVDLSKLKSEFVDLSSQDKKATIIPPICTSLTVRDSYKLKFLAHINDTCEILQAAKPLDLSDCDLPDLWKIELHGHKSLPDFLRRHVKVQMMRLFSIDQEAFDIALSCPALDSFFAGRGKFERFHLSTGVGATFMMFANCRKMSVDVTSPFNMPQLDWLSIDNCPLMENVQDYVGTSSPLRVHIAGSTPKP